MPQLLPLIVAGHEHLVRERFNLDFDVHQLLLCPSSGAVSCIDLIAGHGQFYARLRLLVHRVRLCSTELCTRLVRVSLEICCFFTKLCSRRGDREAAPICTF